MEGHYQQLLRALNSIGEIPDDTWDSLSKLFKLTTLTKHEHFINCGDRPEKIGFVVSGVLRLYYITPAGTELTKDFCVSDDFVAAYSALLQGKESRLSIQALTDTTILTANYRDYEQLSRNDLYLQILGRKLAEQQFIKKEGRESELLLCDAKTRYLNFIKSYPDLEKKIKQYHVASFLGITLITLSRIRAALAAKS